MIGVVDKYDELKNELARIRDKYNLYERDSGVIGSPLYCLTVLEEFIEELRDKTKDLLNEWMLFIS